MRLVFDLFFDTDYKEPVSIKVRVFNIPEISRKVQAKAHLSLMKGLINLTKEYISAANSFTIIIKKLVKYRLYLIGTVKTNMYLLLLMRLLLILKLINTPIVYV